MWLNLIEVEGRQGKVDKGDNIMAIRTRRSTKRVKRNRKAKLTGKTTGKAIGKPTGLAPITETPSIHPPIPESKIPPPNATPSPSAITPSLKDSLLGLPLPGYEGKYWQVNPLDTTPSGFWRSGTGVEIPRTIHIPTGSRLSFIKIHVTLGSGERVEVWKVHEQL